jgi:hypothetical protein
MNSSVVFRWRKSSFSSSGGDCVELGVELGTVRRRPGAVRDSKNPDGPVLHADLSSFIVAIKADRPTR